MITLDNPAGCLHVGRRHKTRSSTQRRIAMTLAYTPLAAVLAAVSLSQRRPAGPPATGFCLWCEEPVAPLVRFCCLDCSKWFDAAATRKRQLGARN